MFDVLLKFWLAANQKNRSIRIWHLAQTSSCVPGCWNFAQTGIAAPRMPTNGGGKEIQGSDIALNP
jgi:hypothetical protein